MQQKSPSVSARASVKALARIQGVGIALPLLNVFISHDGLERLPSIGPNNDGIKGVHLALA